MRKPLFCAALAVGVVIFAGCDSSGRYPVTGTVTFNGEPATGASITFLKKDVIGSTEQTPIGAVVGEDGAFTLAGPTGEGAAPGEYVVLVEWKEGAGKVKGRSPDLSAPDRMKKKYLDPNNPLLTATIEPKTNTLHFELK